MALAFPGRRGVQAPTQLIPSSRSRLAGSQGWSRLNLNDPINNKLVAYYSMDGGTLVGSVLQDLSGSGNTGTLVNAPTVVAGKIGKALRFINSSSQYADIGTLGNFGSQMANFSIGTWISTTLANSGYLMGDFNNGASMGLNIAISSTNGGASASGKLNFYVRDNAAVQVEYATTNATNFNDGNWHHILFTFDNAASAPRMHIYVDGVDIPLTVNGTSTGPLSTNLLNWGYPLTIGARNVRGVIGGFVPATVDDLRIWTRTVTPVEARRLYTETGGNLGLLTPRRRIVGLSSGSYSGSLPNSLTTVGTFAGTVTGGVTLTGKWADALTASEITFTDFDGISFKGVLTGTGSFSGVATATDSEQQTSSAKTGSLVDTVVASSIHAGGLGSFSKSLSDSNVLTSSHQATFVAPGSLTDTVATQEAVFAALGTLSGKLTDGVATGDLIFTSIGLTKILQDSVSTVDTWDGSSTNPTIARSWSDSSGTNTSLAYAMTMAGSRTDNANTDTTVAATNRAALSIADTAATSTVVAVTVSTSKTVTEHLNTASTHAATASSSRGRTDTLGTADTTKSSMRGSTTIAETVGAADQYDFVKTLGPSLKDIVTTSTTFSISTTTVVRSWSELLTSVETWSARLGDYPVVHVGGRVRSRNLLHPPPVPVPDLRVDTKDTRALDFTDVLGPEDDSIVEIVGIDVSRRDGVALGPQDLTITPTSPGVTAPWLSVSPTGDYPEVVTTVNWWQSAGDPVAEPGGQSVQYVVEVSVKTKAGRSLTIDVYQHVSPLLG